MPKVFDATFKNLVDTYPRDYEAAFNLGGAIPLVPENVDLSVVRAIPPAGGVEQRHRDAPEGHQGRRPLRQPVVARPDSSTARAHGAAIGPGVELNFQGEPVRLRGPAAGTVNKGLVRQDPIEDSLPGQPVFSSGAES